MKTNFIFVLFFLFVSNCSFGLSVTFINPGEPNEDYWKASSQFMSAAAKSLNMDLEILYAGRDRFRAMQLAEDMIKREKKPDYVFIVNEQKVAKRMLTQFSENHIKTFLTFVDLNTEDKKELGKPRENLKFWLGSIVANNTIAGELIAKEIIQKAQATLPKGLALNMAAINGDRVTNTSLERRDGLEKVLKENPQIHLNQEIYADWKEDESFGKTEDLFKRYQGINLIWAANDPMAFGALRAAEKKGLKPGQDIFIGGLNWSVKAIENVIQGKMVTTVGGHFMVGGWALVILYDYIHGKDFATENPELRLDVFSALNAKNAGRYKSYFGEGRWNHIDFKKFSKVLNKKIESYDFSLSKVFASVQAANK